MDFGFEFKHCEACGMPMIKPQDFGGEDEKNTWCRYCSNSDGSHKSYTEVLEGMTKFLMTEEGQETSEMKFDTYEKALEYAKNYLSKMPAFK